MARRKPKIATQAVGSMPARDGDDLTEQTNFDEVKDFAKSFFKNGTMPLASHEIQARKVRSQSQRKARRGRKS